MTDIIQLFSGICIVIDEAVNYNEGGPNGIQKIVQSIESRHIPVLKFEELPNKKMLPEFHSISFLILDWNLSGVRPVPQATIDDNIEFLKELKEICFIPIFIFSDEGSRSIEVALDENGISIQNNPIFIKKKDELDTAEKLFGEIENWLKRTPSVYVLKEWELSARKAKTAMLSELSSINPYWPAVLTKAIYDDGGDKSWELTNSLQNNLSNRMVYPEFDNEIIELKDEGVTKDIIRKILECERFIPNDKLPDYPMAGDIYSMDDAYYVNIRPDCDIIREKQDLYLLKGKIIEDTSIISKEGTKSKEDPKSGEDSNPVVVFDKGAFLEKINNCYVAFIDGKILDFSMRKLTIKKWKEIKGNRRGRLLPPYITRIQQKHSAYLQRQGLPSIPREAIE